MTLPLIIDFVGVAGALLTTLCWLPQMLKTVREKDTRALSLPRDREIVVYDSDPNEIASTYVVADLIRQGYRAAALKGGISDWLSANLPTEAKQAPKQAPPEPGALKG